MLAADLPSRPIGTFGKPRLAWPPAEDRYNYGPMLPVDSGRRRAHAEKKVGRWVGLSVHRVMVADLMYFSRRVPTIPVQRHMRLGRRQRGPQPAWNRGPSWVTIFAKAFDLVAADMPVPAALVSQAALGASLRTSDQHRLDRRRERWTPARRPSSSPSCAIRAGIGSGAIDRYLRWFIRSPKANMGLARLGLWVSMLWWPLRRALWWWALNSDGYFRSRQFGTYGISVYSGLGCRVAPPAVAADVRLELWRHRRGGKRDGAR